MPRYTTNVALSIKGDRVEKGTVIELSVEDAARLDPADITPAEEVIEEVIEAPAEAPLEDLSLAELKDRAKALGLSTSGSKADLQERIALAVEAPAETEGEVTSE